MNKESRRANETPEEGMANFEKHMFEIATSNKSRKMQEKVKEELEHIPNWPEPQNMLRMIYQDRRMHSLGRKATSKQTAKEVLKKCISDLETEYPEYEFLYNEDFFNKRS